LLDYFISFKPEEKCLQSRYISLIVLLLGIGILSSNHIYRIYKIVTRTITIEKAISTPYSSHQILTSLLEANERQKAIGPNSYENKIADKNIITVRIV